jgi:hypothetical protein
VQCSAFACRLKAVRQQRQNNIVAETVLTDLNSIHSEMLLLQARPLAHLMRASAIHVPIYPEYRRPACYRIAYCERTHTS